MFHRPEGSCFKLVDLETRQFGSILSIEKRQIVQAGVTADERNSAMLVAVPHFLKDSQRFPLGPAIAALCCVPRLQIAELGDERRIN